MQNTGFARRGFSLIELLVVIAMIAVLAAILFPTFAFVREKTRQTTCMTQMQAIQQSVGLYFQDNNKYPPSLLLALPNPPGLPADMGSAQKNSPLYKFNAKGKDYFVCPDNVATQPTAMTTAVYPPGIPLTGQVKSNGVPVNFYALDSYDIGKQVDKDGNIVPGVYELHYSLDWTGSLGANDPKNQLKYPDPPGDATVLTWCTYHAAINHANVITVLKLNGTAKPIQVNKAIYDPAVPGKTYLPLNLP